VLKNPVPGRGSTKEGKKREETILVNKARLEKKHEKRERKFSKQKNCHQEGKISKKNKVAKNEGGKKSPAIL